ncbi:Metallo-dependent hydrolase [Fomitiporia mediterranea MF3/22]|uniref:Metallo-dependent hydrolase n=1 Tax=Fomitiporia mediterranea (strain MF3/22) TaxID=694068 RepID=UPI0004408C95|nr:Metallo-dependent hydrolase [Fomitiporia mediterranea MF3/22]EJC97920.1 Metallo-dependent hydrolase [Fomitiporia mediterranea MF3/22]
MPNKNQKIRNIRFAHLDAVLSENLYTIRCHGGKVTEIWFQDSDLIDSNAKDADILVEQGHRLCHSHIHLDKCYIIDKGAPLITGDFSEALQVTSDVKATFKNQADDLYARGDKLIRSSVGAGVTHMRAHVEIDRTVKDICLSTGVKLKEAWNGICDVQLCLFVQDPIFDKPEDDVPGSNALICNGVLEHYSKSIDAIGSAPYVEQTRAQQQANIEFILDLATQYHLHVDFHIDYDLSPVPAETNSDKTPLVYFLISKLHEIHWTERMPDRVITLGHATRLSLFTPDQLFDLRTRIGSLPIHFVGLPQSDLYMMGRDSGERGTLNICKLGREYDLAVAMSVNNVGNAFTPQGTPDPLSLCPLGEAVSVGSRQAIGLNNGRDTGSLIPIIGSPADFVLLHGNHSLQSAALEPCYDRTTIRNGRIVASRRSTNLCIH